MGGVLSGDVSFAKIVLVDNLFTAWALTENTFPAIPRHEYIFNFKSSAYSLQQCFQPPLFVVCFFCFDFFFACHFFFRKVEPPLTNISGSSPVFYLILAMSRPEYLLIFNIFLLVEGIMFIVKTFKGKIFISNICPIPLRIK